MDFYRVRQALASFLIATTLSLPTHARAGEFNGFYVGGNIGGISGSAALSDFIPSSSDITDLPRTAAQSVDNGNAGTRGFAGGVQGGYNLRSGNYVFGIETSFDWTDADGTRDTGNVDTGGIARAVDKLSTDWLFTLGPRVGVTNGVGMIYATGGLAVLNQNFSHQMAWSFDSCPASGGLPVCHAGSGSDTRATWMVGGGVEFNLSQHWSIKGEYLYVPGNKISFTTQNESFPGQPIESTANFDHMNVFKVGLNYNF